ncbi:MAG: energy transducer TonB [Thermodesulfovibrionales bacterium]
MGIGRSIIISLIFHTALFIVLFSANYREKTYPPPEDHMLVSVVEEITAITSIDSFPISPPRLTIVSGEVYGASENSKVGMTILVNQHVNISEETNMLHSNTKENESNPPESPHTPLWQRGAGGDFKGREIGLSEEITSRQNTGFSMIENSHKGDTNNPYALIRTAIEKAKTYPLIARKRGMEGTVIVSFRIDGKGLPQDVTIVKSSGYQILDEEVTKMLRKASPFPEINGEIVIPVTFRLKESISDR